MKTLQMVYSGFSRVHVGHTLEIEIAQSKSYEVNTIADEKIIKHIKVSQKGDTLKLGLKPSYVFTAWRRRPVPKVSITMPELYELRLSGTANGNASGFQSSHDLILGLSGASSLQISRLSAGDTRIKLSGASKLNGDISASSAKLDISGASGVELKGSVKDIAVKVSGASYTEMGGLSVNNANVKLSGASHGTVNLSGRLDAGLSGASSLNYIGEPTMGNIKTSGSSKLNKK